ncbi:MAG: TlpA disulfide reductase family protein [Chitinophagaceae bacterium]
MKLIILLIMSGLLFSCNHESIDQSSGFINEKGNAAEFSLNAEYNLVPDSILKNFNSWYRYAYFNVPLSQDFIGLDVDSNKIDKTTFLQKLMTGVVVAFKTKVILGQPVYRLYKLNRNDESIKSTVKQLAYIEMRHLKMEGQQIPEFNFTDLNGNNYTSSSTKGKVILLKCWFIHCGACVKEFPECNTVVDEYKDRKDLLFISLASDTKDQLSTFLQSKTFKYAVVARMNDYMTNKLDINMYPTHLLVDRSGRILKVVNSVEEMKLFLKKEMKNSIN